MYVLAGVTCILEHPNLKDYVLVGERLGSHMSGSFAFPGGKMEVGETPEETCSRECFEEINVKISPERFFFKTFTNDYFEKENKHFITLHYQCKLTFEETTVIKNNEPDKCKGWFFAPFENLPKPHFLPIQNLFKKLI